MARAFVDDSGKPIKLGGELGRGGEGAVFELPGSSLVAKIYHTATDQQKAHKLSAMVRLRTPNLTKFTAWPEGRIVDRAGRETWGVLIPRIQDHREIHHLYSPAHRKFEFPSADWSFLIHVARNCAAAFETIHAAGHLVGDVNQGGILVAKDGTIKLIDCDSFQIRDGSLLYRCNVGVPHFTAPELQGRPFRDLERVPAHDSFGLATIIFHLLFMGRHPFAGRYHGTGDMPIETAIQQGRFAYGAAGAKVQMTPPPHAIRLTHVTPKIADLFERSFRAPIGQPSRPGPADWVAALDDLKTKLTRCSQFAGHKFYAAPGDSQRCPWCEIDKSGGPDLFISITAGHRLQSRFDVAVWAKQLDLIAEPSDFVPTLSPATVSSPVAPVAAQVSATLTSVAGTLAIAALFGPAFGLQSGSYVFLFGGVWVAIRTLSPYARLQRSSKKDAESAKAAYELLDKQWRAKVSGPIASFRNKKSELLKQRSIYLGLPQAFRNEEADLEKRKRETQLKAFLRMHFIEDAKISGVGAGRISVLRSFGIETALDATAERVSAVDGFGPTRTSAVVAWRVSVEQRFRFDATKAVDPSERVALSQAQARRRSAIESALEKGVLELTLVAASVARTADTERKKLEAANDQARAASAMAAALSAPVSKPTLFASIAVALLVFAYLIPRSTEPAPSPSRASVASQADPVPIPKPATPAAAVAPITVSFQSDPPGGQIYLDKQLLGTAPVRKMFTGEETNSPHEVILVSGAEGSGAFKFVPSALLDKNIVLGISRPEVANPARRDDVRLTGVVALRLPQELLVSLDGKDFERGQSFDWSLPIGSHRLTFSWQGTHVPPREFRVRLSETTEVAIPSLVSVELIAIPEGASVLIDGSEFGQTPTTLSAPPGRYSLEFRWPEAPRALKYSLELRDGVGPVRVVAPR